MKKLTPLMAKHYNTALRVGYLDPIETGAKTNTIVGLVDRGLLRGAKRRGARHYLASTPEAVHGTALVEQLEREHAAGRLLPGWSGWDGWIYAVRVMLSYDTVEAWKAAQETIQAAR